jgi:hypothetical protein
MITLPKYWSQCDLTSKGRFTPHPRAQHHKCQEEAKSQGNQALEVQ